MNTPTNEFIPARHSFWPTLFFNTYLNYLIPRRFLKVSFQNFNSDFDPNFNLTFSPNPLKSVLVFCNHFSWWDALLIYHWNGHHVGKQFHCMVLLETLKKNKTLNKVGCYSVNPGNRSSLTTLQYTQELLSNPKNLILIFPQGELQSGHASYIPFKKGINRIMENLGEKTEIILMAGFVDYFSNKKPEVQFYIEKIETKGYTMGLEKVYNSFYSIARQKQGARFS